MGLRRTPVTVALLLRLARRHECAFIEDGPALPGATAGPTCRRVRRLPMNEPLVVRREIKIAAPPSTVFAFLTDPEKILRWMGTEATVEPHPGGLYLCNVPGQ